MTEHTSKVFDYSRIIKLHRYLPAFPVADTPSFICRHCRYVNPGHHQFCSNCGYPHDENKMLAIFNLRSKKRKDLLKICEERITGARVTLYVMSALFFTATAVIFGNLFNKYIMSFTSLLFAVMFFLLARWTHQKPFTALLAAFIILLTCSVIGVIGQLSNTFTSVQGVYGLGITVTLIFLLLRGIQGAHKLELLKDEMEIT